MSVLKLKKPRNDFSQKGSNSEFLNENDSVFVINKLNTHKGNFYVKDINFSIPRGKILSILGASGSGKTLILRSIAGLEKIDSGYIYNGRNRFDILPIEERKLGFVFQNCALFPHYNVKKNISFPLIIKGNKKENIDIKVNEILDEFSIDKIYSGFKPEQLSQGIKQLVALGKEKIRDFELFLMDEPFNFLDKNIHEVMRLFIKRVIDLINKTTIISLNDSKDAMFLSDYIMVIDNGRVLQIGKCFDIYDNPKSPLVLEMISHFGVNKLGVVVKDKKIIPYDIKVDRKEGNYNLYFRAEEIEVVKKGIKAEVQKRFFYNGKNELCECKTESGNMIKLLLPVKINDNFKFIPQKPFLFEGK